MKVSRTLRVTNDLTPWAIAGEFGSSHNIVQMETCPEGVSRTEYREKGALLDHPGQEVASAKLKGSWFRK